MEFFAARCSWSPYDFPWVVSHTKSFIFFPLCGACLEVLECEFEWRATYFGWLRAKLFFASLHMPKIWVWPSINRFRMFLVHTSTHAPTWKVVYEKQPTPNQKSWFFFFLFYFFLFNVLFYFKYLTYMQMASLCIWETLVFRTFYPKWVSPYLM